MTASREEKLGTLKYLIDNNVDGSKLSEIRAYVEKYPQCLSDHSRLGFDIMSFLISKMIGTPGIQLNDFKAVAMLLLELGAPCNSSKNGHTVLHVLIFYNRNKSNNAEISTLLNQYPGIIDYYNNNGVERAIEYLFNNYNNQGTITLQDFKESLSVIADSKYLMSSTYGALKHLCFLNLQNGEHDEIIIKLLQKNNRLVREVQDIIFNDLYQTLSKKIITLDQYKHTVMLLVKCGGNEFKRLSKLLMYLAKLNKNTANINEIIYLCSLLNNNLSSSDDGYFYHFLAELSACYRDNQMSETDFVKTAALLIRNGAFIMTSGLWNQERYKDLVRFNRFLFETYQQNTESEQLLQDLFETLTRQSESSLNRLVAFWKTNAWLSDPNYIVKLHDTNDIVRFIAHLLYFSTNGNNKFFDKYHNLVAVIQPNNILFKILDQILKNNYKLEDRLLDQLFLICSNMSSDECDEFETFDFSLLNLNEMKKILTLNYYYYNFYNDDYVKGSLEKAKEFFIRYLKPLPELNKPYQDNVSSLKETLFDTTELVVESNTTSSQAPIHTLDSSIVQDPIYIDNEFSIACDFLAEKIDVVLNSWIYKYSTTILSPGRVDLIEAFERLRASILNFNGDYEDLVAQLNSKVIFEFCQKYNAWCKNPNDYFMFHDIPHVKLSRLTSLSSKEITMVLSKIASPKQCVDAIHCLILNNYFLLHNDNYMSVIRQFQSLPADWYDTLVQYLITSMKNANAALLATLMFDDELAAVEFIYFMNKYSSYYQDGFQTDNVVIELHKWIGNKDPFSNSGDLFDQYSGETDPIFDAGSDDNGLQLSTLTKR